MSTQNPAPGAAVRARPSRRRIAVAMAIALMADALQWVWLPFVMQGALSPLTDVIDGITAVTLVVLLGWRWQFLPTFLSELLPIVDLAPMWTLAVWLATRPPIRRDDPVGPRKLAP